MVIRKMNNIFHKHGRWLFAVITLVIIVSFVGFLTPGFTSLFTKKRSEMPVGIIFGKSVSSADFRDQVRTGALAMSLQFGGDPSNRMIMNMAQFRAFDTMAMYEAALRRGIRVSDKEIADFIKSLPVFRGASGFDPAKYENYVNKILKPNGFTPQDLDEAVRQSLIVSRLGKQISEEVIVTPDEVKDYFYGIQEKFDVKVARFSAKDFADKIKLDDKDLKSFFELNRRDYMTKPRYKADIVRFNYIDYEKKAAAEITERELLNYYNTHKSEFLDKDKKPLPFIKVKAKVKAKLAANKAKVLAHSDASEFARNAYNAYETAVEDGADGLKAFKEFAAKNKKKVYSLGWFKLGDKQIKGVGSEPELAAAITKIYPKIPIGAALGKRAAFAVYLTGKEDTRKATLEEVKDKVAKRLKDKKASNLAREHARNIALDVSKSDNAAAKLKEMGVKLEKLDTFIPMYKERLYAKDGQLIAQLAMNTPAGKISSPENVGDGALFVFVEKRELPTDEDFKKQKKLIEMKYKQEKQRAAFEAFGSWVKSNCKTSENSQ